MTQPKTISYVVFFCLLLIASGSKASTSAYKMDSLRKAIPSLTGKERQKAWTRLYYTAYDSDHKGLSDKVLDEWIADAHSRNEYWSEAVARQNKIVDLYNAAQYDSVHRMASLAMDFCQAHKLTRKYFEAWHLSICAYHVQGMYNTAVREGRKMHDEAVEKGDMFGQSMAYYNMGNVYFTMRHFQQSVQAFEQSVRLLQNEDTIVSVLLEVYPYYGDALEAVGDFDKLEKMTHEWWVHIEQMSKGEKALDMPSSLANYYIGRAQALLGLGRKDEARKALIDAQHNVADSTTYEYLYLIYYQAQLALQEGRYDEALSLNTKRMSLCSVIDDKPTLVPVNLQRAEILLAANRYKEAAEQFKRTYQLNDSLNTIQTLEQLNEMNTLFKVSELEGKNALQRSRYFTIIVAIVALALLLFLIQRYHALRKVRQKNEELALRNAELRLANQRAMESAKMKANFIRNVSHEIRTPLNIVNGFVGVLVEQDSQLTQQEKKDIAHQVEQNTERMTSLVNKILELSDAKSQTVIEHSDVVAVQKIADDAVEASSIARHLAPVNPDAKVEFQLCSHLPDGYQIRTNLLYAVRALRQLLDNAQKFTEKGLVKLDISLENSQWVVFAVEDTGIGVPEKDEERIFGEFVKLDEDAIGTGVGLPVARNIVRLLGGDIILDITYKGGARFKMTLPTT